MKLKKWFGLALSSFMLANTLAVAPALAKARVSDDDDGGAGEAGSSESDSGRKTTSFTRTVVTEVDGQRVSIDVLFDGVAPDDGVAEGIIGDIVKKLFDEVMDRLKNGDKDGGGGSGGGPTTTCTVQVSGATNVVIGNLNCGTQTGAGGTGSQGGNRPQ